MNRVNVVLSTHNGTDFLEEQLSSIFLQNGVHVDLYIRDDASTDKTPELLLNKINKIRSLDFGTQNLGPALSYFKILKSVPIGDYVAFADQDDVWFPNKLSTAIDSLKKYSGPAIYCSNVFVGTQNCTPRYSTQLPSPKLPLNFFQNSAMGCTLVINSAAHKVLVDFQEENLIMHDWGILLVILSIGDVVFDQSPKIIYRIHPRQVVGLRRYSRLSRVFDLKQVENCISQFNAVRGFIAGRRDPIRHTKAFNLIIELMSARFFRRIWILFFCGQRFRSSVVTEIIFRIKFLIFLSLTVRKN